MAASAIGELSRAASIAEEADDLDDEDPYFGGRAVSLAEPPDIQFLDD
ncbi:hypothetical protein ACWGI8_27990 [Streptomyces sp. NPDC054841]